MDKRRTNNPNVIQDENDSLKPNTKLVKDFEIID